MHARRLLAIFAVAAIGGYATAASAADLGRPVYKAAPPPPMAWTGCFVGVNIGGAGERSRFSDPTTVPATDLGSHTATSFAGGAQAGCDFQAGAWVFGVQGQFDGADLRGSNPVPGVPTTIYTTRIPWFATVTGRVGYAIMPSTLVYARGGAAWIRDRHNVESPGGTVFATGDMTRTGWTAGAGIEHMFAPNWSVFAEYNYLGFGTRRDTFTIVGTGATFPVDVRTDVQNVLVGINYRFRP